MEQPRASGGPEARQARRRHWARPIFATLVGGGLLFAFVVGIGVGQIWRPDPIAAYPTSPSHEQMHQMMDAMHGPGTSAQMHEAMGPDAEPMMDQCASAMQGMQGMQGMMEMMGRGMSSGMPDMMGSPATR